MRRKPARGGLAKLPGSALQGQWPHLLAQDALAIGQVHAELRLQLLAQLALCGDRAAQCWACA